ncbi:carbohydrate binding protein with CBM6 domain [Actinoplanes lutulentus]|uniref:Carbohydrate binding protein with CBM6 domain n=1 Tax=Actinoplanes lutulentus TaxID=1287878 RepID=A0A327ZDV3_9ACTN|nr:carbohydrate binding protein with CBM6 domain [Actinoplanes lutulentus]
MLLGYGLGRWQDTPAEALPQVPVAAPASAAPATSAAPAPVATTEKPKPIEYAALQAESATELAGVEAQDTEDEGGGQNIGWINRNDHLRFDNFEFGEVAATKAKVRVASGAGITGRLEIRLDSKDSAPVGEVSVSNTGGWQVWRTDTAALQPVTGVHTVFVTFAAVDDSEFLNVNWIQFGR